MKEIRVRSTLDGSMEPSLLYFPEGDSSVPLVVGLHTWSFGRENQREAYLPLCRQFGWALLLPEFRGPNRYDNPRAHQACGAMFARQDIVDAVESVCDGRSIDRNNIFLLGCSGGGHIALLTAALRPDLFRAAEVWCPVTDLAAWYAHVVDSEWESYARNMEVCLGGIPATTFREYWDRSPVKYVPELCGVALSIHHGKQDPLVPWRHSAALADELERMGHSALYTDFFDGSHEQMPLHSFEHFARLSGRINCALRITG